jgi:uncharacterized membrane protein
LKKAFAHAAALVATGVLAAVAGCQREDAAAPPAPATAAGSAVPAAASPDTESSLSIKRGTVALTTDTRVLRLCGEGQDMWLVQQDDQVLDETYARLAGEPGTPLFVEMRGKRIESPPGTTIPATFKQAFIIEELLYAAVPAESQGCAAPVPAYRVLARGNEPSWSVEIGGDQLVLRQADAAESVRYPVEESQDAEGSVTYRGARGGQTLEMTVANGPCTDTMSGEFFAYAAEMTVAGKTLRGCARVGE